MVCQLPRGRASPASMHRAHTASCVTAASRFATLRGPACAQPWVVSYRRVCWTCGADHRMLRHALSRHALRWEPCTAASLLCTPARRYCSATLVGAHTRRPVACTDQCTVRSCEWRCESCEEVYCRPCAERLHSKGNMAHHVMTPLPYYTMQQHEVQVRRTASC